MVNEKFPIKVEVFFDDGKKQCLLSVKLFSGETVLDAINESGILTQFPQIDISQQKLGIFSKKVTLQDKVKEGDRIEIYRDLIIDPKTARRLRAKKQHKNS